MIELEPFGLTNGMTRGRPVMLFREKGGGATLPVWLSPLDAGIALGQRAHYATSPHDVTLKLMDRLGLKVESCRFSEVKGNQQYAELKFTGSKRVRTMRVRADHAVSFCLQAGAKFYCTAGYIERCREVDGDLDKPRVALNSRANGRRLGSRYLN